MARYTKPKKNPELKIVFDSNVLYTGVASDLMNQSVANLISESARHKDITLLWYLPEIVVLERMFQMIRKGIELFPSVQKLEQLLGHNLNITEEIIVGKVQDAIQKQLTKYNITVVKLSVEKVDWNRLINNSAFRKPPFEPGEKEKGFRDAVIAETFLQIVKESPTTPRICRIALVTADELLGRAVSEQTPTTTNIRIVKSIDDLKSLINTLVSAVSEEVVAKIKEQAWKYFFVSKQEDTFYYTHKVNQLIEAKFKKELDEIPEGADRRENGTWYISPPRFLNKEGQRVTWISPIEVEANAFKHERQFNIENMGLKIPASSLQSFISPISPSMSPSISPLSTGSAGTSGLMGQLTFQDATTASYSSILAKLLGGGPEKMIAQGRTYFEVTWSHLLSTNQKFRSPRIDELRFIKTFWESKER